MATRTTARTTRKQKQQEILGAGDAPSTLATNLLFRDVGRKLAVVDPNKTISRSLAFDRLWKELRAGELTAGIFIGAQWLEVPCHFWQSLDSDRMKDLLKHRKGKLILHPTELNDVIIDYVTREGGALDPSDLRILIAKSKKGFEPEISAHSWKAFLERNGLVDRAAHHDTSSRGRGNVQSERWRDVAEFILGYCIARPVTGTAKAKLQQDMYAAIEKVGLDIKGWPKESSLRDVITGGVRLSKQIEHVYPKH